MPEIIPNWHPVFVHYTVALLSLAVALSVTAPFIKWPIKDQWQALSRWTLWFGAGVTLITGLTGFYAFNTVAHDAPSHAAMADHRNWAIATIGAFMALAGWSIVRRNMFLGALFIAAMLVAGVVLTLTAWRGGELVYRYGLGVMSLPQAEGAGHLHDHAAGEEHAVEIVLEDASSTSAIAVEGPHADDAPRHSHHDDGHDHEH